MTTTYEGLAAEHYDEFWSQEDFNDIEFFLHLTQNADGPVLDAGCGSGRVLVPLAEAGLLVTGTDSSPEMLERCRANLKRTGQSASLHEQRMEELALDGKFASIFVPGASFQLLTDRDAAAQALNRFFDHLEPGGQLVLATFIPWEDLLDERHDGKWRLHRELERNDNKTVFCHTISEANRHEQLLQTWHRYEVFDEEGELTQTEMHKLTLRWYGIHEMTLLLEKHGFKNVMTYGDFLDEPAADGHTAIAFRAEK
ncbi:MAG: class I SAM-dependent methyltransferase [Verrucomicrobiota bacterium]